MAAARGVRSVVGRAVGTLIEDQWCDVAERADAAGARLASHLLGMQAKTPVTLVGYGHGARVVMACLLALGRSADGRGIVEDCVMMGCTAHPYPADWKAARQVVAGRFVNAFCASDTLLSRRPSLPGLVPAAGVGAAKVGGIVDVDMAWLKPSGRRTYADYRGKLAECLCKVGFEV